MLLYQSHEFTADTVKPSYYQLRRSCCEWNALTPLGAMQPQRLKAMQRLLGGAGAYVQHFLEQVLELVE